MAIASPRGQGFTLIELMVTIAVLAIIMGLALPSFREFLDRSALRGAADAVVSVIGDAKQEAIKRDRFVNVRIKPMTGGFCVGAQEVATGMTTGCDCAAAVCGITEFPAVAGDLKGVTLVGTPDFGFAFDPRTGTLATPGQAGSVDLQGGSGYRVRVQINAMGRANLCAPSGGKTLFGVGACP